tara:strand:- start:1400 stop:1627 length:228 start_codon:yes stop_codon:yes gene_type:complete
MNDLAKWKYEDLLDKIETMISDSSDGWLNINGVAKYTSLSIPKIRRAVKDGELKFSKEGGRLLFKRKWVEQWLLP